LILSGTGKQTLLEVVQKMSDFFWGPKPEQCQNMLQSPFWLPVEEILPWLDPSSILTFDSIKAYLIHYSSGQVLYDRLEEEYVRLFISNRQGIRTPLYASCYIAKNSEERTPLMGEPALAMQERFQSKGLSLAEDIGEPPDHLSIELEYLYFLLKKGWADNNNQLVDEAASFASETMLPWVMKLLQALGEVETAGRFYPLLTTLLCKTLQLIEQLNKVS
jgi:TorA maturation chaperone TorD